MDSLRRKKMTKVYAVWRGEYSDARVEGIFTTEKRAQRLVDHGDSDGTGYGDAYIQDYELDSFGDETPRGRWDVFIHPVTSEILDVHYVGEFGTESPRVVKDENTKWRVTATVVIDGVEMMASGDIQVYRAVVYAETEAKAKKVALDAVAKRKAEEAGL
jgi:hypothetical protein